MQFFLKMLSKIGHCLTSRLEKRIPHIFFCLRICALVTVGASSAADSDVVELYVLVCEAFVIYI